MVLSYIYAALSALFNPWSIFYHPTLLLWTKSISSSLFPRFFLPSTPDLPSLGPVSPILADQATSLNASLASLDHLILPPIDVHHPLTETFNLFRGALISIPHFSSPRFYSTLLVAATMIVFGLYLLRHWFFSDRSFKTALLPPVYHIPFAIALALVENLGDIEDDLPTFEQTVHLDPISALSPCAPPVPQPPANAATQNVEIPLPVPPSVAKARLVPSSSLQVSATPPPLDEPVHNPVPPESSDVQVLEEAIQACVSNLTENNNNLTSPIVAHSGLKTQAVPFVPPSPEAAGTPSVAETTSPYFSFPPSPCLPTEDPSFSLGCSTISEEPTLFPDVDGLKIGTPIKPGSTPERPSVINYVLGNDSNPGCDLDPIGATVPDSHGAVPSQLAPSRDSADHISVLFSCATEDPVVASCVSQPVNGEHMIGVSSETVSPPSPPQGPSSEGTAEADVQHEPHVDQGSKAFESANIPGLSLRGPFDVPISSGYNNAEDKASSAGIFSDSGHLGNSEFVKLVGDTDGGRTETPADLPTPEVPQPPDPVGTPEGLVGDLTLPAGFPFMQVNPIVVGILGEYINNVDWTLINIQLNEEGKFAFEKASLDRSLPSPDLSPSLSESPGNSTPETNGSVPTQAASEESSWLVFGSHSRSDSDLLKHRGISRDFGPRPPFSEGQLPGNLKSLTMRMGLILHETSFRIYEPLAELKLAIQGERTALALATIPRTGKKYVALPRYCFGLTREEFLGMMNTPAPPPPAGWSYADIAKRNVPEMPKPVVRSTPSTPNLEQQSGAGNVWGINKNRGGQEAAILPSEQLEADRQKALRTDKRREVHPSRFRSASTSGTTPFVSFRTRRSSICGPTPATTTTTMGGVEFVLKEGRSIWGSTSAAPPTQGHFPAATVSIPAPAQLANIGKITFHRNATPIQMDHNPTTTAQGSTTSLDSETSNRRRRPSESGVQMQMARRKEFMAPRTRQRSASVGGASARRDSSSVDPVESPTTKGSKSEGVSLTDKKGAPSSGTTDTTTSTASKRSSSAFASFGKRSSRFGRRSSDVVVRTPVLETILGSPPDSPPTQGPTATLTSIQAQLQTGSGGHVGMSVKVTRGGISLDGIVGRAFADIGGLKGTSLPLPASSVRTDAKSFPRIDDDEADEEASRLEAAQRMALSSASESLMESIHAPIRKRVLSGGSRSRYG